MEPNPIPPPPPSPRTSAGAIWSLVLGILSLLCFSVLTGIPAVICGHVAQGKIKRSGGLLTGSGLALAGLITGYLSILLAVVVIPMMVAIAIPNFVKARDAALQNLCTQNLRQIQAAIDQWALANKKTEDAAVTMQDLDPFLKQPMRCPSGGTYQVARVSEKPTCSIPGHALPPGQ